MTVQHRIGVLVMSYGTPQSMEQIEAYYTHIRRGNPPTEEQLKELSDRYNAIVGGVFPLRENTNKQVDSLQEMLDQTADGTTQYVCFQGFKHAAPFIEDGVQQIADAGITEAIGVVLAPHYSIMSVGSYMKRAQEQADKLGIRFRYAKSYHLREKLITALTERVRQALGKFADPEQVRILFTAHSLPESIVEMKDPYPQQLLETAGRIAKQAGIQDWQFAWQSAGRTATPWLGPDILDVMQSLNKEGTNQVLICPIGFVSDHLEILYDLDIEAQQLAKQLGMHLERTESLNQDPQYIGTLREVIAELSEKEPGSYEM